MLVFAHEYLVELMDEKLQRERHTDVFRCTRTLGAVLYRPLTLITIEAVDTAQATTLTTHFNIILGNIPKHCRQAATIDGIFRHTWTNCRQSDDVHTQPIIGSSKGLNFYVLKEAHYDKQKIVGNISTWDIDNTFIPNAAVYAD